MSLKAHWITAVSAALTLLPVAGAFAQTGEQPVNLTPDRESILVEGFEANTGWTSDPLAGGTNLATVSADPQFVSEGSKSLKLDLADLAGWQNNYFSGALTAPIDVHGYNTMSMDVYVPADSIATDSFYQFAVRPDRGAGDNNWSYGTRDLHAGWNQVRWDLQEDWFGEGQQLTGFLFSGNTGGTGFLGPVYVDNLRFWKGSMQGIHPDETLISGFESLDGLTVAENGATAAVNADEQFDLAGSGHSLAIDLTGLAGDWQESALQVNAIPEVDVTNATALLLDVYVPTASIPTEGWGWQVGFKATGNNVWYFGAPTQGLVADRWNTIVVPFARAADIDPAAPLTINSFALRTNAGGPWNGPVYVDNLRALNGVGGVKKGDLNGDTNVDVSDAVLSLRVIVGTEASTPAILAAGDIDGNGQIEVGDTVQILQAAVGMIQL